MPINLKRFDGNAPAPTKGFENELEKVKDGEYEVAVTAIETKDVEVKKEAGCLLTLTLVVENGADVGSTFPHKYFLTNQDKINRFCGDLESIGFDPGNWTTANNRPFSDELDKAIRVLKGMKLKIRKSSKHVEADKTTYHNLYVNGRVADAQGKPTDGKPLMIDAAYLNKMNENAFA